MQEFQIRTYPKQENSRMRKQRKKEVPRYTQVGNAVPPIFAEQIGMAILEVLNIRANE